MGSVVEDYDVVIVGAGLSGLNSAYLLQKHAPELRYVILESRDIIGGTWSFWKYPGARSDSSSVVFRFAWHPWPTNQNFPDADTVQAYAVDAARTQGIDKHIKFQHRVVERRWSTSEQMWTLDVVDGSASAGSSEPKAPGPVRARWLVNCSGYYSYEKPLAAQIPGLKRFRGEVAHPQFWTEAQQVAGKRVVLIGSGATAITMLPHVAREAAHVTMLQRSPSYVLALPRRDRVTALLRRVLPRRLADWVDWYRQITTEALFVFFLLTFPAAGRRLLRWQTQKQLPPGNKVDVDVHFKPQYGPFEQRLCMSPDADFFQALRRPNCDIVTGDIETVTEEGVRVRVKTQAGQAAPDVLDIKADMLITATGLHVELLNGRVPLVDGVPVPAHDRFNWRSCMLEGVPNMCFIIGYTTGTWTPGADAHFRTVLAVMQEMRRRGATAATPTMDPAKRAQLPRRPALPNSSGYLVRARDQLPLSSGKYPWMTGLSYVADAWYNLVGSVKDGMVYTVPDKKGQ